MKIAMLGHKRIPGREGGVEVVVEELAARMAARGHSVCAFNRWDLFGRKAVPGDGRYKGVRVKQVPTLPLSALNAFLYSVLACLRLPFGRYDIVHFHAIGSCAAMPIARPFCRRIVVTIHGLDWQRAKWSRFASWYLRFGERMAARYADAIVVLSRGNQRYFQETYQRETVLIPNGITFYEASPPRAIREKFGLEKDGYVLYLGRIVPEKGLHYLLEAFAGVKTDMRLVIAGEMDPENEYCKGLMEKAARDPRVICAGFAEGEAWRELYSNTALYVLPSDVEGMPMSLLEALGFGARCLVSDIEENIDAAKGCAATFAHGDAESLREALEYWLNHPDERPGQAERAEWEDWDEITEKTLELYRDMAAGVK